MILNISFLISVNSKYGLIKITIFDDMLEITSPGPLPDTMSLEDLGTGRSEIRNRILAPIFKDLGLIEAWGTGMRKIKEAVSRYREIEAIFQEAGYSFQCNSGRGALWKGYLQN